MVGRVHGSNNPAAHFSTFLGLASHILGVEVWCLNAFIGTTKGLRWYGVAVKGFQLAQELGATNSLLNVRPIDRLTLK